jgi:hypothetical protein
LYALCVCLGQCGGLLPDAEDGDGDRDDVRGGGACVAELVDAAELNPDFPPTALNLCLPAGVDTGNGDVNDTEWSPDGVAASTLVQAGVRAIRDGS